MDTVQISIIIILLIVSTATFVVWFFRVAGLEDHLWVEPAFIAFMALLMYLVTK